MVSYRKSLSLQYPYPHFQGCYPPLGIRRARQRKNSSTSSYATPQLDGEPDSVEMVSLEIGDEQKVEAYYKSAFAAFQHNNCLQILKSYAKLMGPQNENNHSYDGDKKGPPTKAKPSWWPENLIHDELNCRSESECIHLLVHIFRGLGDTRSITADKLEDASRGVRKHIQPHQRLVILDEIYKVRRAEECYKRGEIDANTVIYVNKEHTEVKAGLLLCELLLLIWKSLTPLLPPEIHDVIYSFATQGHRWPTSLINENSDTSTFLAGLGDLSGFYFPLNTNLSVLALNKQIRRGALPFAYQNATFLFEDLEDFISFSVPTGPVGRKNIVSLELYWESKADLIVNCTRVKGDYKAHDWLPSVHVSRCIALLREFSNLKLSHLRFDDDMLSAVPLEFFKSHPGILELCSLKVERVHINGFESSLDRDELIKRLKGNFGTLIK
ncbi:hypothetical protein TEQG_01657 [Trichophyton equinum CBS 127.97]|uniref:Subtelomeric hrmA-associated cluster protein AFUB-079030/YDR124W-like helical bundle domain-containing protein n=1 Tax=Trichophyton equinum (strain ATCC MYA-4606 / CBS 127.97) TaxID=559882 RepID=F2PL24_TRIEC|nr:hypothetical protein TEQG_01657 [Trichophyton equinum CBS 127.97]